MKIACRAFAKVNRSLLVLGKRADGYHELDTVFQAIDFSDDLLLESAERFELACSDPSIPTGPENLVAKAARALERATGRPAAARITLEKRIPAGGGLAGGSADAAAALRGLSALLRLELSGERLCEIAASLGSDVPFFLHGGRARGTGRGEVIEPLGDGFEEGLLLLLPAFALSTPAVFRALWAPELTRATPPSKLRSSDPEAMPDRNDLEPAAESLQIELRELRQRLRAAGARTARLSGSGSTVFGVFESMGEAEAAARRLGPLPRGTRAVATRTLGRAEYARRAMPRPAGT